jgi:carbonic anhydrase
LRKRRRGPAEPRLQTALSKGIIEIYIEIRSVVCLEKFEEVGGVGVLTARDVVERARATAARQAPRCAVLTCSDSRVAPELLTLSNLGEMFVVRVAGNVVDDLVLHSLKFAAENLGCGRYT